MKIGFVTDTHITGKNPVSRLDDIQDTIKNKFINIGEIIQKEKIDLMLHGGDLFHTPDVSNKFTGELAEIMQNWGVDTYVVPGNHDLYGYNINTLSHTKLGLLASTGVIKILDRKHPLLIDRNGFKLGIEGQEYYEHIDEGDMNDYDVVNTNVDLSILCVHGMLLDHEFFSGVKHTLINDVISKADIILAGHYHPGWKMVEKDGVTFCNPGSGLRIENTLENRKNTPKLAVIDIDESNATFTINYVDIKCEEGDKVFAESKTKEKATYLNTLETFHNKLKSKQFTGVDCVSLVDEYVKAHPEDSQVSELVKAEMNKFAALDVDKGYVVSKDNVYITRVEIFNFQVHKHKVIDFTKGLNVIVGESNTGKTAILRAIYWALYDKPNGSDFIRTGAKSCKVIVSFSNGFSIERKRSRSSSGSYNLIDPTGNIQEFKGFSNNIPVEITNVHQMPEVKINGKSYRINVASQFDVPFLIGNSPTERVSMIGALVNTDRADEAKKQFSLNNKRKKTEKNSLEELMNEKVEALKQYDNLDKMNKSIQVIEMAISKLDGLERNVKDRKIVRDYYFNYVEQLKNIEKSISQISIPSAELVEEYKNNIDMLQKLSNVSNLLKTLKQKFDIIIKAIVNIPDLNDVKQKLDDYKNAVDKIDSLCKLSSEYKVLSETTFEFKHNVDKAKELADEYKQVMKKYVALSRLLAERNAIPSFDEIDKKIDSINSSVQTLLESKERKINEIKQHEETCPYCKQRIDFDIALR